MPTFEMYTIVQVGLRAWSIIDQDGYTVCCYNHGSSEYNLHNAAHQVAACMDAYWIGR